MKFLLQMKDPDGVFESVREAVEEDVDKLGLPEDERDLLRDEREDRTNEQIKKWVRYGEYLTVEIDTDAGTCVVVPVK